MFSKATNGGQLLVAPVTERSLHGGLPKALAVLIEATSGDSSRSCQVGRK